MESGIKYKAGDGWFRLEDERAGIAVSVHRRGVGRFTCHLDFDMNLETTAPLSGVVHFPKDTEGHTDSSGVVEVHIDDGDTEVYSDDAWLFIAQVRRLLSRAQTKMMDWS